MYAAPSTSVASITSPSKWLNQYSAHIVTAAGEWHAVSFDTRKEAVAYISAQGAELLNKKNFNQQSYLRSANATKNSTPDHQHCD